MYHYVPDVKIKDKSFKRVAGPKVDPYGKTKYEIQNRISYFVLRKVSFVMTQRNTKYKTRFRISYYVRSRLL